MKPTEFNWTEDQQVTVINPTEAPYKFKVHNKEYEVGAGKTVRMPGYIAWVYVYGLASKICQANGEFNRWNEEGFRQTYFEQLVAGVDSVMQTVEPVEEEPTVETFDEVATTPEEEGTTPEEDDSEPQTAVAPMKAASRGRPTKV